MPTNGENISSQTSSRESSAKIPNGEKMANISRKKSRKGKSSKDEKPDTPEAANEDVGKEANTI